MELLAVDKQPLPLPEGQDLPVDVVLHLARFHVDPLQILVPVAESLEIMVG